MPKKPRSGKPKPRRRSVAPVEAASPRYVVVSVRELARCAGEAEARAELETWTPDPGETLFVIRE